MVCQELRLVDVIGGFAAWQSIQADHRFCGGLTQAWCAIQSTWTGMMGKRFPGIGGTSVRWAMLPGGSLPRGIGSRYPRATTTEPSDRGLQKPGASPTLRACPPCAAGDLPYEDGSIWTMASSVC